MTATERYSQGVEQDSILSAVGHIKAGRFLDIGAFNAKVFSNTRALYELGWSGVLIEPSPTPLRGLIAEYGHDERVQIIGGAVGLDRGLIHMHVTDDAISTSDQDQFLKWQKHCNFIGKFWAPSISFHEILNQFGAFDFVSVDTEGTSFAIFSALLDTGMAPRCICVEHDGREGELAALAGPRGYKLICRTGENVVFSL